MSVQLELSGRPLEYESKNKDRTHLLSLAEKQLHDTEGGQIIEDHSSLCQV